MTHRNQQKPPKTMLPFDALPAYEIPLPADCLRLLARLPVWDTTTEIFGEEHSAARKLEKLGLVKISREKIDPIGIYPTWFAGKIVPTVTKARN